MMLQMLAGMVSACHGMPCSLPVGTMPDTGRCFAPVRLAQELDFDVMDFKEPGVDGVDEAGGADDGTGATPDVLMVERRVPPRKSSRRGSGVTSAGAGAGAGAGGGDAGAGGGASSGGSTSGKAAGSGGASIERSATFEAWKAAEGKELVARLVTAKEQVRSKKRRAKDMVQAANAAKRSIDEASTALKRSGDAKVGAVCPWCVCVCA